MAGYLLVQRDLAGSPGSVEFLAVGAPWKKGGTPARWTRRFGDAERFTFGSLSRLLDYCRSQEGYAVVVVTGDRTVILGQRDFPHDP